MSPIVIIAIVIGVITLIVALIGNIPKHPCSICGRNDYRNGGEHNGQTYCTKAHLNKILSKERKENQLNSNLDEFIKLKEELINTTTNP